MARKSIKVEEYSTGNKYFTIYEVKGTHQKFGKIEIIDRFLNKKDAEDFVIFANEVYKDLYTGIYVMDQTVRC